MNAIGYAALKAAHYLISWNRDQAATFKGIQVFRSQENPHPYGLH